MDPTSTAEIGGKMASGPLLVFLSHTSDPMAPGRSRSAPASP